MRRTPRLGLRALASAFLAFCLVVLSPGLPCYQVLAADFEGGAPKGANIRIIPALDLPAIKTGGVEVPGAGVPGIQSVIPQTGIPQTGAPGAELAPGGVIPDLPS